MTIRADETEIVGSWIVADGQVIASKTSKRIEGLVRKHLQLIASARWEGLFRDPDDGRYWERTFPESGMHGGGPPKLAVIDEQQARIKYKF